MNYWDIVKIIYDITLVAMTVYLSGSFFVGIATYIKIRRNTKKRHWGILLGEKKPKIAAMAVSADAAMRWSRKIIKMSDEEVERELDTEFAPTHLI